MITRLIKGILLSILTAGTSLFIAACYGVGAAVEGTSLRTIVNGVVTFEGAGVEDVRVCVANMVVDPYFACAWSGEDGYYQVVDDEIFFDDVWANGGQLLVTDMDGEHPEQSHAVEPGQVPMTFDVSLDEIVTAQ